jgi:hypothetical protein
MKKGKFYIVRSNDFYPLIFDDLVQCINDNDVPVCLVIASNVVPKEADVCFHFDPHVMSAKQIPEADVILYMYKFKNQMR